MNIGNVSLRNKVIIGSLLPMTLVIALGVFVYINVNSLLVTSG